MMTTIVARSSKLLDYCSHGVLLTLTVFDALLASSKVARKWVLAKAIDNWSSMCCSCLELWPNMRRLVLQSLPLFIHLVELSLVAAAARFTWLRLIGCDGAVA
jgi:hypothetical protein